MKYCSECGKENTTSAKFCTTCGKEFDLNDVTINSDKEINNNVINLIKNIGSSNLILGVAICNTIGLLVAFFNIFSSLSTSYYFDTYISSGYQYLESGTKIGVVLGLIPNIIFCYGFWLFYLSCKKTEEDIKTIGLNMIKIALIINAIIFGFIILIVLFFLLVLGNETVADGKLVVVISIVVLGLILAIPSWYLISYIRLIDKIKKIILKEKVNYKVSNFIIVINIIIAFFSFIGSFSSGAMGFISGINTTIFLVLITMILFSYKKEISKYTHYND